MDSYEGADTDPISLHKYLYASADLTNRIDPSGHDGESGLAEEVGTLPAAMTIDVMPVLQGTTIAAMIASDLLAIEKQDEATGQALYRFGNAGGPYPPRVPNDIKPDGRGMVRPTSPFLGPQGASVYSSWEAAPFDRLVL